MAGTLSLTVVYSLDFCRTKLAADAKGKGGERQYKGLIDVYKQTIVSYFIKSGQKSALEQLLKYTGLFG